MKKFLLSSFLFIGLAILIGSAQTGCTKDDIPVPSQSDTIYVNHTDTLYSCDQGIKGLWVGSNTIDGYPQYGSLYWSLVIKTNGQLICESKWLGGETHYAPGTWVLSGDTLTGTYKCVYGLPQHIGNVQTFKGYWNRTVNKIEGIIQNVTVPGSGTFTVNKVL